MRALTGQSDVGYCAGKPKEESRVFCKPDVGYCAGKPKEESRVFCKPDVGYRAGKPKEESRVFVNHSPVARGLKILLVFYQHPAWFISL